MAISAALVKELRERTGAGMMECKKALVETDGDLDVAAEHMRKQGLAKADRKAGRVAAEGRIVIATSDDGKRAAILEVNSETDFVAASAEFQAFCNEIAQRLLIERPEDDAALNGLTLANGRTVEVATKELIAKLGEKISVRRCRVHDLAGDRFGTYLHGSRIGVIVDVKGGDDDLARDLAMHVAASRPICIGPEDVPETILSKEREILAAQARESGKPAEIIDKMVEGRLRKYLSEITLMGQAFVKDPDMTVEKLLSARGAQVLGFSRFEVGEGIEKKVENFAEEVRAQAKGS